MLALLEFLAVDAVPETLLLAVARSEVGGLVARRVGVRDYIPFPPEFRKLFLGVAAIQDIGGENIRGNCDR